MPTLFLTSANSEAQPLPTLKQEFEEVNKLLNDRKLKKDFIVHTLPFANTETIINDLRKFKDDIVVFTFSGHAEKDRLDLEDGSAKAGGIAALLGRCPNLKLVILNGCSTRGQVGALLEKGIPMVIATSAPVDDFRATKFSTTFFEEMAVNRSTVKYAFEEAIAAAKVKSTITSEIKNRGAGFPDTEEDSIPLWGLYFQDDQEDIVNSWKLPENKEDTSNSNLFIQNALVGIFEQFERPLKEQGETDNARDVILKRLPYSISEPIRKLLAPRDNSNQLFFDRPSGERFKMLIYAYRSILAFVSFVLLAQLWELKRNEESVDPGADTARIVELLKIWIKSDYQKNMSTSPLPLLKELLVFFKQKNIPFFLKELGEVAIELMDADGEMADSIDYLEKKITDNPKARLEFLCEDTEQHVAVLLYKFGFLVHYGLTSIKDINVLYYPQDEQPDFEHQIVKLQQALTNLEDRTESNPQHHKTATILLRRIDDKTRYLYLSPFFIDENAYTKTPKAKLCSFVAYDALKKQFRFRHVSKPNDALILIEKERISAIDRVKGNTNAQYHYFPLINGQFSAFCQAVLGKSIDQI